MQRPRSFNLNNKENNSQYRIETKTQTHIYIVMTYANYVAVVKAQVFF